MLNKTTDFDDNRKAVPSTEARLTEAELEQVSAGTGKQTATPGAGTGLRTNTAP